MYKIFRFWPLLLGCSIIISCQSEVEKAGSSANNKFHDEQIIAIHELIDQRKGDSLISFLIHSNAEYRYEAALGFGSIQDTSAILPLSMALNDSSSKVRKAAAYALGQTKDSAAVAPIVQSLQEEDSVLVRRELLEALGKVITQRELRSLQYWPLKSQDDKAGLAWGLYRAGVRNVHDEISIDLALSLLDSSNSFETRLGAAHFLSRSRNIDLSDREALIIKSALSEVSPLVRMACALALRNAKGPSSLQALSKIIIDADYRVRVNVLRALSIYDLPEVKEVLINAIHDSVEHVAVTAANILRNKVAAEDIAAIQSELDSATFYSVKTLLLGAKLSLTTDKSSVIEEVISEYNATTNDYDKAGLLGALGNTVLAQEFVVTKTFSEKSMAVRTAGINALAQMRLQKDFPVELEAAFADIFKQAIQTKDIAMIAVAGRVITNPDLNFKDTYDSALFLKEVKSELELPKNIEAIQMLDRAIAYFDSTEYIAPVNEYNHPIDWELVKRLGKESEAIITTDKGTITLKLFTEKAPGSVANFVTLSENDYYVGKNFHRVVPNFVIQGGCNRGDGFGGEDYSIRSEFANLRYQEGSVGMASAGKDTEGTQWFITHSPTPHLDGGYTIFAQVIEGMDVVHAITIGDKINAIQIK